MARRRLPRIRKINRAFLSVFELSSILGLPIFKYFAKRFYHHEFLFEKGAIIWMHRGVRKHNPPTNWGFAVLGIFQPFVDMTKDVANLGYGYKSTRHVLKDLAQPLRGVGNIIKALLTLVAIPFFLIGILIAAIVPWRNSPIKPHKAKILASLFFNTLLWIPNAAFTFVRGLTQIIFTPLSWFKMALRGILSRKGYQSIKDDRGVRQLINDSESLKKIVRITNEQTQKPEFIQDKDKYLTSVDNELERKARKAQAQGRTLPNGLEQLLEETKPKPAQPKPDEQKFIVEEGSADSEYGTAAQTQKQSTAPVQEKVIPAVTTDAEIPDSQKYRYLTFFKTWMDTPEEDLAPQYRTFSEHSSLVGHGRR